MEVNLEWNDSPHRNNGAEHNVLRTAGRTPVTIIKYGISGQTCVRYDIIKTDGSELTGKCVESLIKLKQLRQLSIGIANII
jgi:hypothetical protein